MKKNTRVKRIIVILLILIGSSYLSPFYEVKSAEKAENEAVEEILKSQSDSVGISSFIKEANKYKSEDFDIDINEIMKSALKGNIDNKKIQKNILSILGKELENSIRTIGSIIVIVIIASVLNSISDNLENKGISQITYYIVYILIVTLIMNNFSEIVIMIKDSINSLVGFTNSLIPLLITLMITTREYSISRNVTTNNISTYYFYRKFYKYNFNSNKFNISFIKYNFKYIR